MIINGVNFSLDQIGAICHRFGAVRLSLFGSILGETFGPNSDVDMLVEFAPQTRIGLIGIANMEAELSEAVSRKVDLRTAAELSREFRDEVIARARLLHAA